MSYLHLDLVALCNLRQQDSAPPPPVASPPPTLCTNSKTLGLKGTSVVVKEGVCHIGTHPHVRHLDSQIYSTERFWVREQGRLLLGM